MRSSTSFSALALRLSSNNVATLPVALDGMYRPSITGLRITRAQRSPAQVNFEIDVSDFDSDLATSSSTAVAGNVYIDAGNNGEDYGPVTIDGTAMLNRAVGTLGGAFQLHVTGAIPSGFSVSFYIQVSDSAGNESNIVAIPIRF